MCLNFNRLENENMETHLDTYWMFINFTVDFRHIIDKNTFIQEVESERETELQKMRGSSSRKRGEQRRGGEGRGQESRGQERRGWD